MSRSGQGLEYSGAGICRTSSASQTVLENTVNGGGNLKYVLPYVLRIAGGQRKNSNKECVNLTCFSLFFLLDVKSNALLKGISVDSVSPTFVFSLFDNARVKVHWDLVNKTLS